MSASNSGGDTLALVELQSLHGMEPSPAGSPSLRFVQLCQVWYEEWIHANLHALNTNAVPPSQILILVFAEAPEIEYPRYDKLKTERTRIFTKAYAQDTQGIVLCNENFRQMYRILPSISSLDGAFSLALTHMQAEDTFAIASLSQRRMFFHLPGGSIPEWCDNPTFTDLRLSTKPLSAALIEADVQNFHKENLRYAKSRVSQMVWKAKKHPYELERSPEQRIQGYLLIYLRGNYKHFKGIVDEEVVGTAGRTDIRVMWPSPIGALHDYTTTMMELKVLMESQGPTYHRTWVTSGITQAEQYRQANTEAVYTCVFDARKDQSDQMLDLNKVAEEKKVRLRRYPMEAPLSGKKQDGSAGDSDEDEEPSAPLKALKKKPRKNAKLQTKKVIKSGGKLAKKAMR